MSFAFNIPFGVERYVPLKTPYIETDGVESYMDLGFIPTVDCSFEVRAKMDDVGTGTAVYIQSASSGRSVRYSILWNRAANELRVSAPSVKVADGEDCYITHTYKYVAGSLDVDGLKYDVSLTGGVVSLKLGTYYSGGDYYATKTKFYYAKFWESGVLIRDLVPYSGPRGVGLLDKVNDVLYQNANTSGTLTYGEE